jgi:hypothetical protein
LAQIILGRRIEVASVWFVHLSILLTASTSLHSLSLPG